jgi:hypothetical protein
MYCKKCSGFMLLDRVFSANRNYEVACILCGVRKFVGKDTSFGKWLHKRESDFAGASARSD